MGSDSPYAILGICACGPGNARLRIVTAKERWRGKEWLQKEPLPPGLPEDASDIWTWLCANAPTDISPVELPLLDLMASAKYRLRQLGSKPGEKFDANEWLRAVKDAQTNYERAAFEMRKHFSDPPPRNRPDLEGKPKVPFGRRKKLAGLERVGKDG